MASEFDDLGFDSEDFGGLIDSDRLNQFLDWDASDWDASEVDLDIFDSCGEPSESHRFDVDDAEPDEEPDAGVRF